MSLPGMLIVTERAYPDGGGYSREKSRYGPSSVWLKCRNTSGGNLTGASTGSDWVVLDMANYSAGLLPPVKKAAAGASGRVLGVVRETAGTAADTAQLWVLIEGVHPAANVDGTTDVAAGDALKVHASTDGAAEKQTSATALICGIATAARTDNSVGACAVYVPNPSNIELS